MTNVLCFLYIEYMRWPLDRYFKTEMSNVIEFFVCCPSSLSYINNNVKLSREETAFVRRHMTRSIYGYYNAGLPWPTSIFNKHVKGMAISLSKTEKNYLGIAHQLERILPYLNDKLNTQLHQLLILLSS